MEEVIDEGLNDGAISDVSLDSIQESPTAKKIQFSKPPKTIRDHAAKVRQIERKIMLGLLLESEEAKLRKSKYFSQRFNKLLYLSKTTRKANLYKLITGIHLNERMMADIQKKVDGSPNNLRRKHLTKIHNLRNREKLAQEKVAAGLLSQNEVNGLLRDMYFVVTFGSNLLALDHNDVYKPETLVFPDVGKGMLLCDYCLSSHERNRFGQHEELLICKDCGNKAHPSCLSYSLELVEQIRSDGSWQCIDCKACIICKGTGDPDTLLFCDACDKGYHMQCHNPVLNQMPSGKWACSTCLSKGKKILSDSMSSSAEVFLICDDDDGDAAKTTSSAANNPATALHNPTMLQSSHVGGQVNGVVSLTPTKVLGKGTVNNISHILNPKAPVPDVRSSIRQDVLRVLPADVADWTTEDVVLYFKSHGYLEEASALQEQEIDGRALLLMSRNDCLSSLQIKLGPALKIYHMHIYKLQSRTNFLG